MFKAKTALEISSLNEYGRHNCGNGLYLEIDSRGKRWLFRFQLRGKRTTLGLGTFDKRTNGLATARERAAEYMVLVKKGINPKIHKDTVKQQEAHLEAQLQRDRAKTEATFSKLAQGWYESQSKQWTGKHSYQNISTLEHYAFPLIGDLPIQDCTTEAVARVLKPIWASKTETASRIRGRIERVFNYAKSLGHFKGENPAAWKGNLDAVFASANKLKANKALESEHGGHFASMPYTEVPAFYKTLSSKQSISAKALRSLVLTIPRASTNTSMKWEDINFSTGIWTIHGLDMKSRKQFLIPLSKQALALLEALPRLSDWVFTSPSKRDRPITEDSMRVLLQREMGLGKAATVHGFRSSFRTWCEEQGKDRVVAELCMGHRVGSAVERAYQRSDLLERRRQLLQEWADYLEKPEATK